MSRRKNNSRAITSWLVWSCALAAVAQAVPLPTNDTPATRTALAPGTLIVTDDLNANVGRPYTVLGAYADSRYQPHDLFLTDVDSSTLGNGHASQLIGVPLRFNGSAYFRVSGAPDLTFIGQQSQTGSYSYQFDVFDANHNLIESIPPEYENVTPGMIDNIWLESSSDPRRVGGTVNVTINNVIGPGTGDSRDFFLFAGLQPFQEFSAHVDTPAFPAMIGLFSLNTLVTKSDPLDPTATISGHADAQGRVLIGVTGAPDSGFTGQHAEVGAYTLVVLPVPEPSAAALALLGAILVGTLRARRNRGSAP